ncbi:MAG TPA: uracil-DNA glycosylase family protein [Bacteroidales bacterium]|nr:uracil-DNA glycosylase family protein [Bacteroidales bacterium]
METFADKAIRFHQQLQLELPGSDVAVMNPFRDKAVMRMVTQFYKQFFDDNNPRTFLLGINPGRFGAGITGISFTDPIHLETKCGIVNDFDKKHELSSQFIYQVIDAMGGAKAFYSKFYFTAVSPLGFTRAGKNVNYYDEPAFKQLVLPFIQTTLQEQLAFGAGRRSAICIGGGENYKFLNRLNDELQLFEEIVPLEHPRFVMQYRRKSLDDYINKYLTTLKRCELSNSR